MWGTAIAVPLIILFNSQAFSQFIVLLGFFGVALSSAPIVTSKTLGLGSKIFLVFLYFVGASIVVVLLGMALLCLHKCS